MRVSEWVLVAFFSWTSALAVSLPISGAMRARVLLSNLAVLLAYVILFQFRGRRWMEYTRDWAPQATMILAYRQMNWFAPPFHTNAFEHNWIVWDRILLDNLGMRAAIESLGAVIPFVLELSYLLVYALPPLTMGVLYLVGRRRESDVLLTIYMLGLTLCYAQFPFWPSEPPRTVFPGQDLPGIITPVREFNLWLVGSYGIHTSVFPSAHVSGAFAAAMAMAYILRKHRWIVVCYFAYAALVAVATIYGRYHYAVDALGGALIGILCGPAGLKLACSSLALRRRSETPADPVRHAIGCESS